MRIRLSQTAETLLQSGESDKKLLKVIHIGVKQGENWEEKEVEESNESFLNRI